jgi:hypothetical protein
VPGDGTFTAERTPQALTDMAQRIEKGGADAFEGVVSKGKPPTGHAGVRSSPLPLPSSAPGVASFLDHAVTEVVQAHHQHGIGSADIVDMLMKETETKGNAQYTEGQVLQALRRAEQAGDVVYRSDEGAWRPGQPVRRAQIERDVLKLIPEKGLDGKELEAAIEKQFGKEAWAKSGRVGGERRQIENALRRLLREQRIHRFQGRWRKGGPPEGVSVEEHTFIQKETKE